MFVLELSLTVNVAISGSIMQSKITKREFAASKRYLYEDNHGTAVREVLDRAQQTPPFSAKRTSTTPTTGIRRRSPPGDQRQAEPVAETIARTLAGA